MNLAASDERENISSLWPFLWTTTEKCCPLLGWIFPLPIIWSKSVSQEWSGYCLLLNSRSNNDDNPNCIPTPIHQVSHRHMQCVCFGFIYNDKWLFKAKKKKPIIYNRKRSGHCINDLTKHCCLESSSWPSTGQQSTACTEPWSWWTLATWWSAVRTSAIFIHGAQLCLVASWLIWGKFISLKWFLNETSKSLQTFCSLSQVYVKTKGKLPKCSQTLFCLECKGCAHELY